MVTAAEQERLDELATQRKDYLTGWAIGTRQFGGQRKGRHAPTRSDSPALKQGFQDARTQRRAEKEDYLEQVEKYKESLEYSRLKKAAELKEKAKFGKVEIDSNQELARRFQVMSIPTLIFFRDGHQIDRHSGILQKEEIEKKIKDSR